MPRRLLLCVCLIAACSNGEESQRGDTGTQPDACTFEGAAEAELPEPKPHTPRWAFRPWISKDISDGADTYAFVKGFEERDTPVGVVVLDSPWETHYNTFVPNPKRYPEFPKLVSDLHAKDIKLVLWITQMVNRMAFDYEPGGDRYDGESPNYEEGLACGFYVNGGDTYGWWKGIGAGVDFFHPRARAWWHAQQKPLLDLGVDGWKLDFGENYIDTKVVKTFAGDKPHQAYSEAYYRDFLAYGRSSRGRDFVTMVRPWDMSYDFEGRFFARREHAPVAWVGDNKRDWVGLVDALDHVFRSAQAGYVVVGSDIGGYLDVDDKNLAKIPADTVTFSRWTAMSAWMPFFQLHGRANYTPWTVPDHVDETVAMYRYWAKLHDALVPLFYSLSEEAWAKGGSMLKPLGATPAEWANDWRFLVGDVFLVAPLIDATGKRDVKLPDGTRWFDWWTGEERSGAVAVDLAADRLRLPVFVREGAIVPLDVVDDANALGTKASKGARTILHWPSSKATSFALHEEDDVTTSIESIASGLKLSRSTRPVLLRMRAETSATKAVRIDEAGKEEELPFFATRAELDAALRGWMRDAAEKTVWIKVEASAKPFSIATR
ncbi:MAG: glycoside hydrolase family 31 protein [Deltaproteobacteria bacterium]|nr:glycoside hydrolase family 31 protein [Deltaproteobacteria bacterium]